ncbi:hypothetical protein M3Y99_01868400 [Aphelenchoides fujianensis]|nr:hypothetical protein M3Y99_01868400 [Aphelenchoides fujianensis]
MRDGASLAVDEHGRVDALLDTRRRPRRMVLQPFSAFSFGVIPRWVEEELPMDVSLVEPEVIAPSIRPLLSATANPPVQQHAGTQTESGCPHCSRNLPPPPSYAQSTSSSLLPVHEFSNDSRPPPYSAELRED